MTLQLYLYSFQLAAHQYHSSSFDNGQWLSTIPEALTITFWKGRPKPFSATSARLSPKVLAALQRRAHVSHRPPQCFCTGPCPLVSSGQGPTLSRMFLLQIRSQLDMYRGATSLLKAVLWENALYHKDATMSSLRRSMPKTFPFHDDKLVFQMLSSCAQQLK